jgi:hypothetical protein
LLEQGPPRQSAWTIGRRIVESLRNNPTPVAMAHARCFEMVFSMA